MSTPTSTDLARLERKQKNGRLLYRMFGATTIHLEHEVLLWTSLSILTVSSFQALYRNSSFGTSGDLSYCLMASFWLSRHVILRYIYTTDFSTLRSPSIIGIIVHWASSIAVGGQYFDRPDSQVVARNVGISHVEDVMNPASVFSLPSASYSLRCLRVKLVDPVVNLLNPDLNESIYSMMRKSAFLSESLADFISHPTVQRIGHYGPPLQLLLASFVFALCTFYLPADSYSPGTVSYYLTIQPVSNRNGDGYPTSDNDDIIAEGAYEPLAPPSWYRVFFLISCAATMLSILFYGRVSFPIPDLVAGSNVLKAVRNEARGTAVKSTKARVQKEQQETAWTEAYKSIVTENRFRLACKVALLRSIDAVICCALLPRTFYVCRVTGHCPENHTLGELKKILYPAAVSGLYRDDGSHGNMFQWINPDRGSAIVTILSVIFITMLVLFSQLVTLNKSYLAIMGHLAGEWKLVDGKANIGPASQWDPRRRYKKGDLIVHSFAGFSSSVYMATTNSPEGRPFDLFLRATHDLFRHELGHQSTSTVTVMAAKVHLAFVGAIMMVLMSYVYMDYADTALLTALFANVFACFGMLYLGLTDYDEFEDIASEINVS